jgi:hypothetical protein
MKRVYLRTLFVDPLGNAEFARLKGPDWAFFYE